MDLSNIDSFMVQLSEDNDKRILSVYRRAIKYGKYSFFKTAAAKRRMAHFEKLNIHLFVLIDLKYKVEGFAARSVLAKNSTVSNIFDNYLYYIKFVRKNAE